MAVTAHGRPSGRQPRVVGTAIQASPAVLDLVECREHQDGHATARCSEPPADLDTVEARQDQVEDNEVVGVGGSPFEGVDPVVDHIDRMAIRDQRDPHGIRDIGLVFDAQDAHGSVSSSGWLACSDGSRLRQGPSPGVTPSSFRTNSQTSAADVGARARRVVVREDGRARLSDELYPDVVGEFLLAHLERQDPVARATAWLRSERSWRHHLAPLLEIG